MLTALLITGWIAGALLTAWVCGRLCSWAEDIPGAVILTALLWPLLPLVALLSIVRAPLITMSEHGARTARKRRGE